MILNKEEIHYLNELLISAVEWDDESPTDLIRSIEDKLAQQLRHDC